MKDAPSLPTDLSSADGIAEAFRQHVDLIYSTARRMVADEQLAQDVVQATFLVLMKKGSRVDPRILPGWLVNTTRLAAKNALRHERTRIRHETLAAPLREPMEIVRDEPTVEQIAPLLDEALSKLSEEDRAAVVMRFLEGASFAQVGEIFGTGEDGARKKVSRAVEKLRAIFMRQGVVASMGGLLIVLAAQQARAAPAAFVSATTAALAAGGSAAGAHLAGGVLGAMRMAWIKVYATLFATAVVLMGGAWEMYDFSKVTAPRPVTVAATKQAAPMTSPSAAPISPTKLELEDANSIGMSFVEIKPGTFLMGSGPAEKGRSNGEAQHRVTLTKGFFMATTPVTQAQWMAIMQANPSKFHGDLLPVDQVDYPDALEFCLKLSEKEKKHYRLPTEAEWEYACRAGTTTAYYNGDDEQALARAGWYMSNAQRKTQPVGQKQPNAWGLYDMLGNIDQWCSDWYEEYPPGDAIDPQGPDAGQFRVLRGGTWDDYASECRSASRSGSVPREHFNYLNGVRVVRDLQ